MMVVLWWRCVRCCRWWLRGRIDTLETVFQATARNFTIRLAEALAKYLCSLMRRAETLATPETECLLCATYWFRPIFGCQIGRTSPRSCFRGSGVAQSFFVRNSKRRASSPGCCVWCKDTIRQGLAACSRAAQLVDESLGTLHGGWVQTKMCFDMSCFCDRI